MSTAAPGEEPRQEIIIVRRNHDHDEGHHGGVWNIAFADFMTAMMCFFLVMWLINAANEQTKAAVASYFNPVKLIDRNSSKKGLEDLSEGASTADTTSENTPDAKTSEEEADQENAAQDVANKDKNETHTDKHLFANPYAVLAEIAEETGLLQNISTRGDGGVQKSGPSTGAHGGQAYRDPFAPDFWSQQVSGRETAEGILFYINGKPKEAMEALSSVDPMAYTPDIAMYLALVKGSILSEAEPQNALALLDRARLLAPGTLVEEAALRRSIAAAANLGDAKRLLRLSEQYVRGYLRSPYASQFADAFVAGVVTLSATIDRDAVAAVADMMEPEQEKVIYLRIARRAAIDGLIDFAAFAASHAEGVENDPRAELYSSLSNVTSGTIKDVLENLSKIDRGLLSESDRQLLDAASAFAARR